MSNATTHTSEGSAFEFSIESQVSEIVVELEVCVTNGCNVVTVYIDPPPLDALKAEGQGEQKVVFWNERPSDISKCTTDFRFSHQLANPEVVAQMMFGPGSHIEPHEHMLYWESGGVEGIETVPGKKRQVSRKIQLYAPADIYRIHVGQANRTTEPFFFIQLSDPQLGLTAEKKDVSKEEGLAREVAQFESAIAEANRLRPDFVVVTGDLCHHNLDQVEVAEIKRIAGGLDPAIPIYWTTGNRDSGCDDGVPIPSMLAKYRQEFGDDYYSFDHKGTTFITISSTVIFDPSQTRDEWDAQSEFIETELEASVERGAANRIIFTHHPLFTDDPNEEDAPTNLPLARRKPLLELFHKFDVSAVFAGHLHQNNYAKDGEMLMIATTAVGMQAGDDDPGYRVVKVLPNGIEHQYYPFTSGPDSVQLG